MPDWDALLTPSLPLLEVVIRGTVVYLALTVFLRVAGQRESGGLGLTDLLVVVLLTQAVGGGLAGDTTSIVDGLLLVAVILFWSITLDWVAYRWPSTAVLLKSRPKPLIEDGRLNRQAMHREFMTRDELLSQLRLQGVAEVDEVHRAYLEPNGMVSVIRRDGASEPGSPHPELP